MGSPAAFDVDHEGVGADRMKKDTRKNAIESGGHLYLLTDWLLGQMRGDERAAVKRIEADAFQELERYTWSDTPGGCSNVEQVSAS